MHCRQIGLLLLLSFQFGCFFPPSLSKNEVRQIQNASSQYPLRNVNISIDDYGIPHIFASDEVDAAYGVGFMHGRDRQFQVDLMRHASSGRLTEMFGARALDADRKLRILTFNVQEQYEQLSYTDKKMLQAYADGVNAGANESGKTLEHFILGKKFNNRPFTPQDALTIARLQAWELASDLEEELMREKIISTIGSGSALAEIYTTRLQEKVPIIKTSASDQNFAVPFYIRYPFHGFNVSQAQHEPRLQNIPVPEKIDPLAQELLNYVGFDGGGASNSWAVSGEKTLSGCPILSNDPHLTHRAPGVFYLAHIELPDATVVGATFPGVPAVLIGHGKDIAWGITASFADVQDLVKVPVKRNTSKFGYTKQDFYDEKGELLTSEDWAYTSEGPVLPKGWQHQQPGFAYVVMWPAFIAGGTNQNIVSGFWNLAKSKTADEALQAIEQVSFSGMNIAFALTTGDIGYKLAASIPVRSKDNISLPKLATDQPTWLGFLIGDNKPYVVNPEDGIIVAANQRVVSDDHPAAKWLGASSAHPHRARRIKERIDELVKRGKHVVTLQTILNIQQDVTSLEAISLVPVFASYCPSSVEGFAQHVVESFCKEIANFDGQYTVSSLGALPYTKLFENLRYAVLEAHTNTDVAQLTKGKYYFLDLLLEQELVKISLGIDSPFFSGDLKNLMAVAVKNTLQYLNDTTGLAPINWRWGNVHRLKAGSPLSQAPIIGGLFDSSSTEEAGHNRTPRAEAGIPVERGAAFRMVAEMCQTPSVHMVIDTGQSGSPKHEHFEDQKPLWHRGELLKIPLTKDDIEQHLEGKIELIANQTPAP